ncbi:MULTISPECIES: hypothetical protein [unclassified Acinetobacter]|uniref:hypothetical protein n=1 Tax=unclassified Acinetobacter TaxID=196816 RepID=UPI00190A57A4|nr:MULTISPECIES: hypothetical protein [unclassified Acinetobacter]MBK0062168.1 hypothetical protein [Acinetobacter sp. S55]MBK0065972.1 hypothetical protein [Acinetobacter sp. S54]
MNAAVTIMQATDWSKYSLEEWLYQFGAWMYSNTGICGKSINPIAVAMDQAVTKRKKFKLGVKKKRQMIAYYISSEEQPTVRRKGCACEITDNEARAVQRLILDMQGQSEILDEWLDAVIDRYFYGNSWPNMVIKVGRVDNPTILRSEMDARSDVKCGLAALHSRYGFIKYK